MASTTTEITNAPITFFYCPSLRTKRNTTGANRLDYAMCAGATWVGGNAIPAFSSFDGVATMLTIRDVTRELALEDERDRLAAIAEESPYPIVELDRDAQMLYANPVMVALLSRFGFSDSGWSDLFPPDLPSLIERSLAPQLIQQRAGRELLQLGAVQIEGKKRTSVRSEHVLPPCASRRDTVDVASPTASA